MNDNLTQIVAVLDRSGSMWAIMDDAIGGFNQFLKDQQELPGEANIRTILFDDQYETLYSGDIDTMKPLTHETFVPRGWTRLLDAIGMAIQETGQELAALPEKDRPGKVLIFIYTDGHENSSKEYTRERVAEMVKHQTEKYNWEFIFLAADLGTTELGKEMNIDKSYSFDATPKGCGQMYRAVSVATQSYRGGKGVDEEALKSLKDEE